MDVKEQLRDVKRSTIFHELYENLLRVNGTDYQSARDGGNEKIGAHAQAENYERRVKKFGNPQPGSHIYVPPSDPWNFKR